ncbi:alpha/beta hydrolase [Gordonia hankookensis]|uniref:Alpha/beta fold hydrolase n=1 Tax=Gordonia hankookensis TaxID=589403 RepID=A0ABR7W9N1_9ACTN|nr:alpha/beta fold hydrolase [Gordonia hankookensis]MBD1318537.1 alpha/beta fold hydrolase [Gordonia hankookensis]
MRSARLPTPAVRRRSSPELAVLVLPGGTDSSYRPFSPRQASALRMYPFTWSIRARFGRSVRVRQVRYRVYGWNGRQDSPMPYARAALDDLERTHPGVPVVLIGHSMGGRVGAQLAADRRVVGLLALAPWWQYADWRFIHDGVRVVAIHGTADQRTYPRRTEKGVHELQARGVDATFVPVPDGDHAMLDHIRLWQGAALDFVGAALSRGRLPAPSSAQEETFAPADAITSSRYSGR